MMEMVSCTKAVTRASHDMIHAKSRYDEIKKIPHITQYFWRIPIQTCLSGTKDDHNEEDCVRRAASIQQAFDHEK